MNVLVIDIGGTNIKFMACSQNKASKFKSGKQMTPERMVAELSEQIKEWDIEAVSIGYPGVLKQDQIISEPKNLGSGWVGFDFQAAFKVPIKIVNDAALQALGSYQGGKLLFLGLGTGLGSALIVDGIVVPLELAHLPYKENATFENYVGVQAFEQQGKESWEKSVHDVVNRLNAALLPDEIVLGGGNAANMETLPANCRLGSNSNAFLGGFRLWSDACVRHECHFDFTDA